MDGLKEKVPGKPGQALAGANLVFYDLIRGPGRVGDVRPGNFEIRQTSSRRGPVLIDFV